MANQSHRRSARRFEDDRLFQDPIDQPAAEPPTPKRPAPVKDEWVVVCNQCGWSEQKLTARPRPKCPNDDTMLIRFPVTGGQVPADAQLTILNVKMRDAAAQVTKAEQNYRDINAARNRILNSMLVEHAKEAPKL